MRFSSAVVLASIIVSAIAAPVGDAAGSIDIFSRGNAAVNPNAVTGTKCTNKATKLDNHDINVALLQICGGIQGAIEQCQGAPKSTVGQSGTAKFLIKPEVAGSSIVVSKGRWEGCVRAARATCGDSPFTTTCIGGGSKGNLDVTLVPS